MTTRYTKDDATVIAMASLLDMGATNGTSNALNEMQRDGDITDDMNIGQLAFAYTQFQQRKLLSLNSK